MATLCSAQDIIPQTGLHYYVLVNRETDTVVQRGTAGSAGVAFDRLILAPNTDYRVWILQAATLRTGFEDFTSPGAGQSFEIPDILLGDDIAADGDGDGLSVDGEFVMGTSDSNPDTDGDDLSDRVEVQQGGDPLSGFITRTGLIGSVKTPGSAGDICAINDIAIVTEGTAGVSIFNVFNGMNPVLIGRVDTPGTGEAVACSGDLVAVADGSSGLAVIDISDPPAASIVHQIKLAGPATCVAAAGPLAFVGLSTRQVVAVDLPTGTVLSQVTLGRAAQDLAVSGERVFVWTDGQLFGLTYGSGIVTLESTTTGRGGLGAGRRRLRLFAGPLRAYATHTSGYNIFDVSLPGAPSLVESVVTTQFGWKQIVANGSGLGVAAVSPNSTDDGPHHVSLYDLDNDGNGSTFVTEFETPGLAAALSIYNGIAYVADSREGLQVLNYLGFDTTGEPPSIALTSNFADGSAEEGTLMRLTAAVRDNVQVRNVEFYLDGEKIGTDGNFPFEHRFTTPVITPQSDSFVVQARASDTGGNATWTDEIVFQLVPDATPPRLVRVLPAAGGIVGAVGTVTAFFSEALVPASLTPESFQLRGAGPDGVFGTGDDFTVGGGTRTYRDATNSAVLTFSSSLAPGTYRANLRAAIVDLAGNPLTPEFSWSFRVFSLEDRDLDGVPDELETLIGLDPDNPDTDGDGIIDGLEDHDRDGLSNAGEVIVGTDIQNPDSNNNGIPDGEEDPDGDFLTNAREMELGTNPLNADSDADGWNDETELAGGSDPNDPNSKPKLMIVSHPPLSLGVPRFDADFAAGTYVAAPPVSVGLPRFDPGISVAGVTVAQPALSISLPVLDAAATVGGVTVAQPPVKIERPVP